MGRASSKAHLRWPPEVAEQGRAILEWAMANTEGDLERSPMAAACSLILSNLREDAREAAARKPDGRTVSYGARIAAVHPQTGDYIAAGPWVYDLQGMDAVWKYVSETAWQLYEGMDALPIELGVGDLTERTNTARVAMSRRADGVAVIRVRFVWQKKREKRNLRRGMENEPTQVTWEPQEAQVNVWIGPKDEAKAVDQAEKAARHPLAYND